MVVEKPQNGCIAMCFLKRPTSTFSAANENTEFAAVVSVRRDCEEPAPSLSVQVTSKPEPTVTIENAEAGEYFVFVDGGGPERWVSSDADIDLQSGPRNFNARNDINENCWGDGGNIASTATVD